jgi:uncharacterized Zn-binding protein involved in type VI secretion
MAYSHRHGDSRACGATTIVVGQDFVTIEGQLWSVDGDPNTDGGGELSASKTFITINGKAIIVAGDSAAPDALCFIVGGLHCAPSATGFSSLVDVN